MVRSPAVTQIQAEEEAQAIIAEMRQAVAAGDGHWFLSLLAAVRRWPLAQEEVGERTYRYLVGGEAFDWLLLAERLCEELHGLIPAKECEQLLFHGSFPLEMDEEEWQRLLGAKHRAHLNFLYGVRVEEALHLAVQAEVEKERLSSRIWENGHVDDEAYQRIYDASKHELLNQFRSRHPPSVVGEMSLADLDEFTYWLFKHRLRNADPARVASDTQKGLAQLQRLEARRRRTPTR